MMLSERKSNYRSGSLSIYIFGAWLCVDKKRNVFEMNMGPSKNGGLFCDLWSLRLTGDIKFDLFSVVQGDWRNMGSVGPDSYKPECRMSNSCFGK